MSDTIIVIALCPHGGQGDLEPLDRDPLYAVTPCPRLSCPGGKRMVLRGYTGDYPILPLHTTIWVEEEDGLL